MIACSLEDDQRMRSAMLQRHRVSLDNRPIASDFNRVDPVQYQPVQYLSGQEEWLSNVLLPNAKPDLSCVKQLQGSSFTVEDELGTVRNAKIGLVIQIKGTKYATTVAHVFSNQLENDIPPQANISMSSFKIHHPHHGPIFGKPLLYDITNHSNASITSDYALLPILCRLDTEFKLLTSEELEQRITIAPQDNQVQTASDFTSILRGTLSVIPAFIRLPSGKGFQKVWTVHLDRPVQGGDCGTMVIDSKNGCIYGHIIAGSPSSMHAYILPAYLLLDSLRASGLLAVRDEKRACSPTAVIVRKMVLFLLITEICVMVWLMSMSRSKDLRVLLGGVTLTLLMTLATFPSRYRGISQAPERQMVPHIAYQVRSLSEKINSHNGLLVLIMTSVLCFILLALCLSSLFILWARTLITKEPPPIHRPTMDLMFSNCTIDGTMIQAPGITARLQNSTLCISPSSGMDPILQLSNPHHISTSPTAFQADLVSPSISVNSNVDPPPTWTVPIDLQHQSLKFVFSGYISGGIIWAFDKVPSPYTAINDMFSWDNLPPILSLTNKPRLLDLLVKAGNISQRSFGLDVGSSSLSQPRSGALVLGGSNPSSRGALLGSFDLTTDGPPEHSEATRWLCQFMVRIKFMTLRSQNGSISLDFARHTRGCVEPYN
ncbi:hypothetical protein QBC36DRAFT_55708 [Triangularia setosa]|uniref:Uncharacterized protein n=1 Tax=Triangularia setosa TaxID=2587417 RepID=A0AAN7A5V9_9PEZI|nr:hypothetical protein QBC36DRAFT_55708 [Podospora setosa]